MATIDLLEHSGAKMLGTRPAARAFEPAMRAALSDGSVSLDTSGIRRIGLSFFDETLLIFGDLLAETGDNSLQMIYRKGPELESLKDMVPHRGLTLHESPDGDWIISPPQ